MTLAQAYKELVILSYMRKDLGIGEADLNTTTGNVDATPVRLVQLRGLINRGIQIVARHLCPFDHDIGLTITAGTSRYNLNSLSVVQKRITKLYSGYAMGKGTFFGPDSTNPGTWTPSQMSTISNGESWREAVAGEPTRIIDLGRATSEILLWPTPSASYVTSFTSTPQIRLAGEFLPAELATDGTADATELPLPVVLHDAVVWCAAEKGRQPTAQDGVVWQALQAFNTEWVNLVRELRVQQANDMVGGAVIKKREYVG